jgi:hypothetical protein
LVKTEDEREAIMITTELDPKNISAAAGKIPANTPFLMLNLLRYRDEAAYSDPNVAKFSTGREAYLLGYLPAFGVVASKSELTKSIQPILIGSVIQTIVGPVDERWDDMALVQYPNFEAFRAVAQSEEYQRDAEPHRLAALENLRLIAIIQRDRP